MAIISICRGTKSGGQALAECLADDRNAIDVLKEMKPDAEVIVVNHKPES